MMIRDWRRNFVLIGLCLFAGETLAGPSTQPTTRSSSEKKHPQVQHNSHMRLAYYIVYPRYFRPAVTVTKAQIDAFVRIGAAKIRRHYEGKRESYCPLATLKARHLILLFAKFGHPTTQELKVFTKKLASIRKEAVQRPNDFVKLIKKHSRGPAGKFGGLLPWVKEKTPGWSPPFLAATAKLRKVGEISPIVRTRFGLHLIQLVGRKGKPCRHLTPKLQRSIAAILLREQAREVLLHKEIRLALVQWQKRGRHFDPLKPAATTRMGKLFQGATTSERLVTPTFRMADAKLHVDKAGDVGAAFIKRAFQLKRIGETLFWSRKIGGKYCFFALHSKQISTMRR